jgi:hypothetical protein
LKLMAISIAFGPAPMCGATLIDGRFRAEQVGEAA